MSEPTLDDIADAIRISWSPDTAFASDEFMAPTATVTPSRGQCGPTSMVLNDWLGGELIVADVLANGVEVGVHYWNRLPSGLEVDLTRDQFLSHEVVSGSREVTRSPGTSPRYGVEQYHLLRDRVTTLLAVDPSSK